MTQGGYQVGRNSDNYPLFLAVREQNVDTREGHLNRSIFLPHSSASPGDELDGSLQIVLETRPSLEIDHVEGYPVIPRTETIGYARELGYLRVSTHHAHPHVRGSRF